MKKNTIIILVAVADLFLWGKSSYNGMVNKEETVNSQWANVETQYQRRSDLIPDLVATVKGYATHESSTLEGVVAARAKETHVTIDPATLTPEKVQEYQVAQSKKPKHRNT